jgi:DNA polymerase-3 subunit delta
MPRAAVRSPAPVVLVCGDDEFAVKQRARQLFEEWSAELGGMDHEIIDAAVSHSGDALRALGKLREALNTFPFFGGAKAVWFRNCNFLGDERTASAAAVTENLGALAQDLKEFVWDNVRLLISAGKVDKRKVFYKTLDKIGRVEAFAAWSMDDRDWADRASALARERLREEGRSIGEEALAELVQNVGPNPRQLHNEIEKVATYAGDRKEILPRDVAAVVTRNKQARAFALGDALGDRDLPRLLRCLSGELWEMKTDSQKSAIRLLYGLITKIRVMIFLKELTRLGRLKPVGDYPRFKAMLGNLPAGDLPEDPRFNPLALNPYVLYKAMPQTKNYRLDELIHAMDLLLQANRRLVSSGLDDALVLQQTLVQIVTGEDAPRNPVVPRPMISRGRAPGVER